MKPFRLTKNHEVHDIFLNNNGDEENDNQEGDAEMEQ